MDVGLHAGIDGGEAGQPGGGDFSAGDRLDVLVLDDGVARGEDLGRRVIVEGRLLVLMNKRNAAGEEKREGERRPHDPTCCLHQACIPPHSPKPPFPLRNTN